MKKSILLVTTLLLGGGLFSTLTTFAEEVENVDSDEVQETVTVTDLTMAPAGIGVRDIINLSTTATITMTANFGNVQGSGKATKIMDNIYVKARIYNANGVLGNQKASSQNKTDYHSVKTSNALVSFSKNYGFANATYKKAGYNTVSNETRVNQK